VICALAAAPFDRGEMLFITRRHFKISVYLLIFVKKSSQLSQHVTGNIALRKMPCAC